MKRTKALVVGSIAFDIVFQVHNVFRDEIIIKDNQASSISMMLTARNKKMHFGGTAGNIAYGLGIQGESPLLFSVAGGDFDKDYRQHLSEHNVDVRVIVKPDEYTATFYAISDQVKDQVGIFQPNTHGDYFEQISLTETLTDKDFAAIKIAIFSTTTAISLKKHMSELRKHAGPKPVIIFDPSQTLSIFFDKKLTEDCIKLANIFIGNETEVEQLQKLLEMKISDIFKLGLKYVIETKGKHGCIIYSRKGRIKIPAFKPKKFVEQTGAGDAFRAGLIKGLLHDLPIEDSCRLAAKLGALNVASEGGQNYQLI